MKEVKNKIIEFVKENQGLSMAIAAGVLLVATIIAYKNRQALIEWIKANYGSIDGKLDKLLETVSAQGK